MKPYFLHLVLEPVIAFGGTMTALYRLGFYEWTAQAIPSNDMITNVGTTGILGAIVWFLLVRLESSVKANTTATTAQTEEFKKLADEIRKVANK